MIFTPYCSYFTVGKHEDAYQSNIACAVDTSITWYVICVFTIYLLLLNDTIQLQLTFIHTFVNNKSLFTV